MNKENLEKMISGLEEGNLHIVFQIKNLTDAIDRCNPKNVSDIINLQKVMLNNNDLIDKYKEELNQPQKYDFIGIQNYWERLYLDNDKQLIIKTTDSMRGIGKTSFLVEMCKKYDGVFLIDKFQRKRMLKDLYGLEDKYVKYYEQGTKLDEDKLILLDEEFTENVGLYRFTNYIMIKRVD